MKHVLKFSGTLLAIFGMLMITSTAIAQGPPVECNTVLESECIGACGAANINYIATEKGFLTVSNINSSLCPNTGARAQVYVNGHKKGGKFDMTAVGSGKKLHVKAGDVITVEPSLYGLDNGILCVWLGELTFALCE